MDPNTPVVFCKTTNSIIDFVHSKPEQTPETAIARLTPEYGANLVVMPLKEAHDLYEAGFKKPVEEITSEDFYWALNCLPPVGWGRFGEAETFKMCERIAGNVTTIYVAMRGRYFKFCDSIKTPALECCDRVADFIDG